MKQHFSNNLTIDSFKNRQFFKNKHSKKYTNHGQPNKKQNSKQKLIKKLLSKKQLNRSKLNSKIFKYHKYIEYTDKYLQKLLLLKTKRAKIFLKRRQIEQKKRKDQNNSNEQARILKDLTNSNSSNEKSGDSSNKILNSNSCNSQVNSSFLKHSDKSKSKDQKQKSSSQQKIDENENFVFLISFQRSQKIPNINSFSMNKTIQLPSSGHKQEQNSNNISNHNSFHLDPNKSSENNQNQILRDLQQSTKQAATQQIQKLLKALQLQEDNFNTELLQINNQQNSEQDQIKKQQFQLLSTITVFSQFLGSNEFFKQKKFDKCKKKIQEIQKELKYQDQSKSKRSIALIKLSFKKILITIRFEAYQKLQSTSTYKNTFQALQNLRK